MNVSFCLPHPVAVSDFIICSGWCVCTESAVDVNHTIWYMVFICHQDNVCENSIGSVYVGGSCVLSESGLCVFGKFYPVGFLVVCECYSVLLQSVVISYVDYGDDG